MPRSETEYAEWLATMPDGLRDSATAEALEAIVDLDLASDHRHDIGRNRDERRNVTVFNPADKISGVPASREGGF